MVKKPAAKQTQPNVSKDELLKYYRDMLLIRRFEEKAGQLYGMGAIGGFCHLQATINKFLDGIFETLCVTTKEFCCHGHHVTI